MRHPVLAGALTAVLIAGGASDAFAVTTVSRTGDVVTVTGGDEVNVVRVFRNDGSSIGDDGGVAAGPGCTLVPDRQVARCDTAVPVRRISLSLGGGDDRILSLESAEREEPLLASPPLTADLGPGDDEALGSRSDDTLSGGPGRDDLRGGGGDDTIDGGPGADELAGDDVQLDYSDSGGLPGRLPFGDDRLLARDGEGDRILCGLGADSVVADAFDSSAAVADCERRDGLSRMTARIVAVRPISLSRLASGGALRITMSCSRACTAGATLFIPKAEARRLGLNTLPIDTVIGYRLASGTGTIRVTIRVSGAIRAKLRSAGRLNARIVIVADDAAGVRANVVKRRLVLRG